MTRPEPACRLAAVVLLAFLSMPLVGSSLAGAEEMSAEHAIKAQPWSFGGFRGQYDQAQLQRGFQVFQQVCTACHGLKRVRFRNLAEPGGPDFPEAAVKALAVSWPYQISGELDDEGNPIDRLPGLADPIIGPYKNDKQARATQNGALPPDLSLIVRARSVESHAPWYSQWLSMLIDMASGYQDGGADYVYALLTGYRDPPADVQVNEGMYYNVAFPGHQLAMPPPLSKDSVIEYQPDAGAKASFEQNARDVTAFLAWAADPNLDARKRLGWQVLFYLAITTLLLYLVKKRIWGRLKH
jgi:ubiquinol-cytochrome c reductase cytochrome c1 subunit